MAKWWSAGFKQGNFSMVTDAAGYIYAWDHTMWTGATPDLVVCMADLGDLLNIHTNVPAEQPLKAPAPVAPEPEPVPVPA